MTTSVPLGRSSVSSPQRATAIASSFATRTSPSIPPASKIYEPHLKFVLSKKFVYNVLGGAGIISWFVSLLWVSLQQGGSGRFGVLRWIVNLLSPVTVIYSFFWWIAAAVPIAVVRKSYLNTPNNTYLSPREALFNRIFERAYRETFLVLLSSSLSLALFYSFSSSLTSTNDPKLGLWAGSKKHPLHINGRFLFLILSQISGATLYFTRDALRSRLHLQVAKRSDLSLWPTISSCIVDSLISSLILAAATTIISLVSFGALRSIFLPVIYRLPILHSFLRPFIAHFLRPTFTITLLWSNFDLLRRSFTLAFSCMMLWDLTSSLFEFNFSVPIDLTPISKDSGTMIASGITSTDRYFLHHVYNELSDIIADDDLLKRTAIFNDSLHHTPLCSVIIRQCLLLLGKDYQLLLNRGNEPPASPEASQPAQGKPDELGKSSVQIIHGPVYKNTSGSPLDAIADTLSSESVVTKALIDTTSGAIGSSVNISDVLHVAGSCTPKSLKERTKMIKEESTKMVEEVKTLAFPIKSYFRLTSHPSLLSFLSWWTRERMDKAVQRALPNKELDIMIISTLSALIAKSLNNDVLGHVQRDIPRVLEALVSFYSALEKYQAEALTKYAVRKPDSQDNSPVTPENVYNSAEVIAANLWIDSVKTALQTGITYIINTFGDRLASFKFPVQVASELQKYVDYNN